MNERRDDRRKQTEKRQYNADGIHADCSPKVKHNYAIAALADREHFHETRKITGHKRNVGGLQRDIAALSHRDTHRGFGGYVLASPESPTIYHSGDTAYFAGFSEIGRRLQPDIALLPIGAYFPDTYRAVHTNPEEALRGFLECHAKWMVPMHYGTFRLGREPMDEPVQRLEAEARRVGVWQQVRVLGEGETMRLSAPAVGTPPRTVGPQSGAQTRAPSA